MVGRSSLALFPDATAQLESRRIPHLPIVPSFVSGSKPHHSHGQSPRTEGSPSSIPRSVPGPAANQGCPRPWLEPPDQPPKQRGIPRLHQPCDIAQALFRIWRLHVTEKVARHDDVLGPKNTISSGSPASPTCQRIPARNQDFTLAWPPSHSNISPTPFSSSAQKWVPRRNQMSGWCKRLLWRHSAPQLKYHSVHLHL